MTDFFLGGLPLGWKVFGGFVWIAVGVFCLVAGYALVWPLAIDTFVWVKRHLGGDRRQRRADLRSIQTDLDEAARERHRPQLAAIAAERR